MLQIPKFKNDKWEINRYLIFFHNFLGKEDEVDFEALKKVKELAFKQDQDNSIHSSKKKLYDKIKVGIKLLDNYPKDLMEDPSIKANPVNFFKKYSENLLSLTAIVIANLCVSYIMVD